MVPLLGTRSVISAVHSLPIVMVAAPAVSTLHRRIVQPPAPFIGRARPNPAIRQYLDGGLEGSGVLRITGMDTRVHPTIIPYNPSFLYKVTCRIRPITRPTDSAKYKLYVGVEGVAGNESTLVDRNGAAVYTAMYFCCADGVDLYSLTLNEWVEYAGYFSGRGSYVGNASDPNSPCGLHADVRYFRPMYRVNCEGGDGTIELDELGWEIVPKNLDEIADSTSYKRITTVSRDALLRATPAAGDNVLMNPNFEDGSYFWLLPTGASLETDSTKAHNGNNYVEMPEGTDTAVFLKHTHDDLVTEKLFEINPGDGVNFSAAIYRESGNSTITVGVLFYDKDGTYLSGYSDSCSSTLSVWQHAGSRVTAPPDAKYLVFFVKSLGASSAGVFRVDKCLLSIDRGKGNTFCVSQLGRSDCAGTVLELPCQADLVPTTGEVLVLGVDGLLKKATAEMAGSFVPFIMLNYHPDEDLLLVAAPGSVVNYWNWSWTAGKKVYLNASTAGALTQSIPQETTGSLCFPVGIALSTTSMLTFPICHPLIEADRDALLKVLAGTSTAVCNAGDTYLYAAVGTALYRSTDGINWGSSIYTFGASVAGLMMAGSYLYAACGADLYRSSDGTTWSGVNTFPYNISAMALCNGAIYVGLATNGAVYRSPTGALGSWTLVLTPNASCTDVRDFLYFDSKVWAGLTSTSTSYSVYNSSDGVTWGNIAIGEVDVRSLCIIGTVLYASTRAGNVYYIATGGSALALAWASGTINLDCMRLLGTQNYYIFGNAVMHGDTKGRLMVSALTGTSNFQVATFKNHIYSILNGTLYRFGKRMFVVE